MSYSVSHSPPWRPHAASPLPCGESKLLRGAGTGILQLPERKFHSILYVTYFIVIKVYEIHYVLVIAVFNKCLASVLEI